MNKEKIDTSSSDDYNPKQSVQVVIKTKFSPTTLNYLNSKLKHLIFSGWVCEREYFENLFGYRDIVEIDEWETETIQRINHVMSSIKGVMDGSKWINITVPSSISSCYSLWTLLSEPQNPGHYWIEIDEVSADPKLGLKINLKLLRPIHKFDGETKEEREKRQKKILIPNEWDEFVNMIQNFKLDSLQQNILSALRPSNITFAIRLFVILLSTLGYVLSNFLQNFGHFSLLFIKECGVFIHYATPLGQSLIKFIEKIFGGFYLLLAMVYRDFKSRQPPPQPNHINQEPYTPAIEGTRVRSRAYVPSESWD